MSKIQENRELYLVHTLLSHYRFIKKVNSMNAEEFKALIYNISPSIYSAFKNKDFKNIQNIITDYIAIIDKTIRSIKDGIIKNKTNDNYKECLQRDLSIIRLTYINKKELSKEEIEKKLKLGECHFCRYIIYALKEFSQRFNRIAERMGYPNALTNTDIRLIEIARLAEKAEAQQKIA